MPSTYVLSNRMHLVRHYSTLSMWLGDYAELDAIARSGDYFITLATELDTIAAELPETSTAVSSIALSRLAQKLEYMQRHYQVVRKRATGSHPEQTVN